MKNYFILNLEYINTIKNINSSPIVSHNLEVIEIMPAKKEGNISFNAIVIIPSLTPRPAGTKIAHKPIMPARAVEPVT